MRSTKNPKKNLPIGEFSSLSDSTFHEINSATNIPADASSSVSLPQAVFQEFQANLDRAPVLPQNTASRYESSTAYKHSRIAFDPETMKAINIDTGTEKTYEKSNPIIFILSDSVMPGTFTPAAARLQRYNEDMSSDDILIDKKGNAFVICPSHGDIVKVESLQSDHADSSSAIRSRQVEMVAALNNKPDVAARFIEFFKLDDLLVEYQNKIYGTLYFYERYYNDIENLWNICQTCNLHKSDKQALDWFASHEYFNKAFMDHLKELGLKEEGLIITAGGKGLAEVALTWHREKFAEINSTTKIFYKEVVFEIQENFQKARQAIANKDDMKAEAYLVKAELDTHLASSFTKLKYKVHVKGSTPPPPSSPGSTGSTSDEDSKLLETTPDIFRKAFEKTKKTVTKIATREVKMTLRNYLRETNKYSVEELKSLISQSSRQEQQHREQADTLKVKIDGYKEQLQLMELQHNPH
jgi:hypothetical protein